MSRPDPHGQDRQDPDQQAPDQPDSVAPPFGRLRAQPAPELTASAYRRELAAGTWLHPGLGLADLAHAVMLVEAGLVPRERGVVLLRALLAFEQVPAAEIARADEADANLAGIGYGNPAHGDVYSNRMRALHARVPEAAGWLALGRPRREATTLAYFLAVRHGLLAFADRAASLGQALVAKARHHTDTLMRDYTYLQPAHPTTFAHYLLTFVPPVLRDLDRLALAWQHHDACPAGAGSTNGSRLPLDRPRLAALLGFRDLALHTRDAMWPGDTAIETSALVTAALVNADRLAEDLQIFATEEFGYLTLDDAHVRTSVIMPQKRNPYGLAYVRGIARRAIGELTSVAALQATPSGQVDNRVFAYETVPAALDESARGLHLLGRVVAAMRIDRRAMAERLRHGFCGATDLAELISQRVGLDAATAHCVVGHAIRLASDAAAAVPGGSADPSEAPRLDARRLDAQQLDRQRLDRACQDVTGRPLGLSAEAIADALSPQRAIAARTGPGGASPASVAALLDSFSQQLTERQGWIRQRHEKLVADAASLRARARFLADEQPVVEENGGA